MGFAALRLASLAGTGFLRSLSSRGTLHGVLCKAAMPIETRIRTMTKPRRIFIGVFDFLGGLGSFHLPQKVSHRLDWTGSGPSVGRWGFKRKSGYPQKAGPANAHAPRRTSP